MPKPLTIWTEGIHDVKFLSDVLSAKYPSAVLTLAKGAKSATLQSDEVDIKVLETGGKSAFVTASGFQDLKQKLQDEEIQGRSNVFILDADSGYEEQRTLLNAAMGESFSASSVFLWPQNAEHNHGNANHDLEMLLVDIIQPQHRQILDCWEQYESCLADGYTKPAVKTKIYGFFEANHPSSEAGKEACKDPNRNYRDESLWDLNNEALEPLKTFLNQHLT